MGPASILMIVAGLATPWTAQAQDLKVVTTLTTYASIAREILGDAGTARPVAKPLEGLGLEEVLRDRPVGAGIFFALQVFEIGCG